MTQPRTLHTSFFVTLLVMIVVCCASWWVYREIGKTPGELMDYAQRRLHGHNRIEKVALPVIAQLRDWLNQPSRQSLLQVAFEVPRPPALLKSPSASEPGKGMPSADAAKHILRVGPNQAVRSIAQAAQLARDQDIVEIDAGEYHGDVAVWHQKQLTVRTRGGQVRLFADGKSAEGKAIWVIRNGDFSIENIDFVGTHVTDHNGAGIRFEGGNLRIRNCLFYANDSGLLTTGSAGDLSVEDSEFAYNGYGDGLSHNIYVGQIHQLRITGSYFHHANVGHLIKSRAQRNFIYYNRVTDELGGRASYEIDFPNGGLAYVVGNIIQKDVAPQNSTLITFGEEGMKWNDNALYLASNTIVNDQAYGSAFVRTAPGTQRLVSTNNLVVGSGKYHIGSVRAESVNDVRASWNIFAQASRYDYRLNDKGRALHYVAPTDTGLIPGSEYVPERSTSPLKQPPHFPGALQSP
jgi:hypothetical protein